MLHILLIYFRMFFVHFLNESAPFLTVISRLNAVRPLLLLKLSLYPFSVFPNDLTFPNDNAFLLLLTVEVLAEVYKLLAFDVAHLGLAGVFPLEVVFGESADTFAPCTVGPHVVNLLGRTEIVKGSNYAPLLPCQGLLS